MNSRTSLLILALSAIATAGCIKKTAPLENPAPFMAAKDVKLTEEAINYGFSNRGWTPQERQPGAITALLEKRTHKLWARITYDDRSIQITFQGSENLLQSQEGNTIIIHRRVNTWLKNLQSDINAYILRGGPPVAAPPPAPRAAAPAASGPRSTIVDENLPYCQSGIDCGSGSFCKDRGDGIKLCMGEGANGDYCKSGIDCGSGMFCKARGDGFKVCMGNGLRGDFCKNGIDCGSGMFCKNRGDGYQVCM